MMLDTCTSVEDGDEASLRAVVATYDPAALGRFLARHKREKTAAAATGIVLDQLLTVPTRAAATQARIMLQRGRDGFTAHFQPLVDMVEASPEEWAQWPDMYHNITSFYKQVLDGTYDLAIVATMDAIGIEPYLFWLSTAVVENLDSSMFATMRDDIVNLYAGSKGCRECILDEIAFRVAPGSATSRREGGKQQLQMLNVRATGLLLDSIVRIRMRSSSTGSLDRAC